MVKGSGRQSGQGQVEVIVVVAIDLQVSRCSFAPASRCRRRDDGARRRKRAGALSWSRRRPRCQNPVLTAMAHDAEAQAITRLVSTPPRVKEVTIGKDVVIGHEGGEQRPAAIRRQEARVGP